MRLRNNDKLTVELNEDTVFLHPSSDGNPSDDPFLRGTLTLSLSAPRRITRLRVQLKGLVTMHGGGEYRYETSQTLVKTLDLDIGNERLSKGVHSYQFAFIIPSSTAVGERSKYGTVRHTLRAWCDGLGSFGNTLYSPYSPVWFIANPQPPGELPQGVEIVVQDFGNDLGPVALHVSSSHLTVSSLVFMNISLLAPPALQILSVTGYISQQFHVTYIDAEIGVASPPPQRKLLFYVDQTTPINEDSLLDRDNIGRGASLPLAFESRRLHPKPLVELPGEEEWSYSRIVRVPDDDQVRPTTLDGTDTKIRVKHKLVAEVRYRPKGSKKDMVLEMSADVTIASCCCLTDSLLLPSYAFSAPKQTPIRPFHRRCLCNSSLQEMVRKDGVELSRADVRPHRRQLSSDTVPSKLGLGPNERYLGRRGSTTGLGFGPRFVRRRSGGGGVGGTLAALSPAVGVGGTRSAPGAMVARTESVGEVEPGEEVEEEKSEEDDDPDAITELTRPRLRHIVL